MFSTPFTFLKFNTSQAGPFSPADIPGLIDWWSASSNLTLTSNDVDSWQGINGLNLIANSNYTARAVYQASDAYFNNKPSILFDTTSLATNSPFSTYSPTIVLIGKIGNVYGNYNGITGISQFPGVVNGGEGRFSIFNKTVNDINLFSDPPNGERSINSSGWNTNLFYIELGFYNNVTSIYSNNGLIGTDTIMNYTNPFSSTSNSLFVSEYGQNIGGNGTNTYTDVIFVDGPLTTEQRNSIINWAQLEYFPI